jgi:hypothetical protein
MDWEHWIKLLLFNILLLVFVTLYLYFLIFCINNWIRDFFTYIHYVYNKGIGIVYISIIQRKAWNSTKKGFEKTWKKNWKKWKKN